MLPTSFAFLFLTLQAAPTEAKGQDQITIQTTIDEAFLRDVDTDGDGKVGPEEYLAYQMAKFGKAVDANPRAKAQYTPEEQAKIRAGMAESFRAADVNGDGALTSDDLPAAVARARAGHPGMVASMMQLSIAVPATLPAAERNAKAKAFADAAGKVRSCTDADALAQRIGADVVKIAQMELTQIPKQLRDQILRNPVGTPTEPYHDAPNVRVLIRCDQGPKV